MSQSSVSAALVEAYHATSYRVFLDDRPFDLRVGQYSDALGSLYQATRTCTAVFVTAENPFSLTFSTVENCASQRLLAQQLSALTEHIFEGAGQGHDEVWPPEASFLALGISREQACALGQQFGQNAIIWADADSVPELILLR